MTKAELVSAIAEKGDLTKKDAEKSLNAVTAAISDALAKGERVQIVGFGTFEVRDRKAKDGINPKTKQPIKIEAKKAPAFKPSSSLKDAVN